MEENSGRTAPKTRASAATEHPYGKYEGSPQWALVATALADLVANGDISERTDRNYIIGYFCKVLAGDRN